MFWNIFSCCVLELFVSCVHPHWYWAPTEVFNRKTFWSFCRKIHGKMPLNEVNHTWRNSQYLCVDFCIENINHLAIKWTFFCYQEKVRRYATFFNWKMSFCVNIQTIKFIYENKKQHIAEGNVFIILDTAVFKNRFGSIAAELNKSTIKKKNGNFIEKLSREWERTSEKFSVKQKYEFIAFLLRPNEQLKFELIGNAVCRSVRSFFRQLLFGF